MNLRRPCYDKPHRCPGWAGSGWKLSRDDNRCNNGSIRIQGQHLHPRSKPLRFGHCTKCNIVTLPWAARFLDPRWYSIYWLRVKWRFQ